jgi:uncharacterized protein YehS (DUF1456 family)
MRPMGAPTSDVGYTSATTRRGDHEVYKGHVVAFGKKEKKKGYPRCIEAFLSVRFYKIISLLYQQIYT